MWQDDDEYLIRCGCGHFNHLIQLWAHLDDMEELPEHLYFSFRNEYQPTLWGRIKDSFRYAFNRRDCLLQDEILIRLDTKDGRKEVEGIITFLEKVLKQSKDIKMLD